MPIRRVDLWPADGRRIASHRPVLMRSTFSTQLICADDIKPMCLRMVVFICVSSCSLRTRIMGLINNGHASWLAKLAESGYGSAGLQVRSAVDAADGADGADADLDADRVSLTCVPLSVYSCH